MTSRRRGGSLASPESSGEKRLDPHLPRKVHAIRPTINRAIAEPCAGQGVTELTPASGVGPRGQEQPLPIPVRMSESG